MMVFDMFHNTIPQKNNDTDIIVNQTNSPKTFLVICKIFKN